MVVIALSSHLQYVARVRATSGLSCLLVLYSAPGRFSPGSRVFPSPQKSTFPSSDVGPPCKSLSGEWSFLGKYLTVILRVRAGYELIYITNEAVGRVGYYQLISGKSEKNNCFSKFSSNSLDFFG